MKIMAMVAMAGLAGLAQAGDAKQTVTVYTTNEHVAMMAAGFAKNQGAKMFATAGVQIEWRSAGKAPLTADAIVVDFLAQGPATRCAGALACASVYEGVHIHIFFDRLQHSVPTGAVPSLLATCWSTRSPTSCRASIATPTKG
jgi:hypothetical protein